MGALARDLLDLERRAADMYFRVRREPREGTFTDAARCHAQACGFVAYVLDVHPDFVARAIASEEAPDEA